MTENKNDLDEDLDATISLLEPTEPPPLAVQFVYNFATHANIKYKDCYLASVNPTSPVRKFNPIAETVGSAVGDAGDLALMTTTTYPLRGTGRWLILLLGYCTQKTYTQKAKRIKALVEKGTLAKAVSTWEKEETRLRVLYEAGVQLFVIFQKQINQCKEPKHLEAFAQDCAERMLKHLDKVGQQPYRIIDEFNADLVVEGVLNGKSKVNTLSKLTFGTLGRKGRKFAPSRAKGSRLVSWADYLLGRERTGANFIKRSGIWVPKEPGHTDTFVHGCYIRKRSTHYRSLGFRFPSLRESKMIASDAAYFKGKRYTKIRHEIWAEEGEPFLPNATDMLELSLRIMRMKEWGNGASEEIKEALASNTLVAIETKTAVSVLSDKADIILAQIGDTYKSAAHHILEFRRKKWWPRQFQVPKAHIPRFDDTAKSLCDNIYEALKKDNKLVLTGAGGVGKSTLVKYYAEVYERRYDKIIWMDAGGEVSNLFQDFQALSGALGIENTHQSSLLHVAEACFQKLEGSHNILFILDNAESYNSGTVHVLPQPAWAYPNFAFIITSRDDGACWGGHQKIQLGCFSREESEELLTLHLDCADVHQKTLHQQRCRVLARALGDHPLAIQTALVAIRNGEPDVVERFTKKLLQGIHPHYDGAMLEDVRLDFVASIKRTMEVIQTTKPHGALASELLSIIPYFNPDWIPQSLLCRITERDLEDVMEALRLLRRYSLVSLHEGGKEGSVRLHALLQAVLKSIYVDSGKEEDILLKILEKTTIGIPASYLVYPLTLAGEITSIDNQLKARIALSIDFQKFVCFERFHVCAAVSRIRTEVREKQFLSGKRNRRRRKALAQAFLSEAFIYSRLAFMAGNKEEALKVSTNIQKLINRKKYFIPKVDNVTTAVWFLTAVSLGYISVNEQLSRCKLDMWHLLMLRENGKEFSSTYDCSHGGKTLDLTHVQIFDLWAWHTLFETDFSSLTFNGKDVVEREGCKPVPEVDYHKLFPNRPKFIAVNWEKTFDFCHHLRPETEHLNIGSDYTGSVDENATSNLRSLTLPHIKWDTIESVIKQCTRLQKLEVFNDGERHFRLDKTDMSLVDWLKFYRP